MIIGCSNPSLGSAKHNLWNCGGTLGETSLDFGGSCQGGDMQVSLQKKCWKCKKEFTIPDLLKNVAWHESNHFGGKK